MIKIDDKGFQEEIAKLKSRLSRSKVALATMRAMNRAIGMAKTEAKRQIRERYVIKASRVDKHLKTGKASKNRLEATLKARTAQTPMQELGNPRQNRKGTAATVIKGQRKTIKHAFVTTLKSGHKGVFAKSNQSDKSKVRFDFRKKRLSNKGNDTPIQEVKTVSVAQATLNDLVMKVIETKTTKDYEKRMIHELKRLIGQ
jgi:hypothetical protein